MKKIFLLFAAAVAALSSCVKENGLEPQVNTDSKVTINAVAVDSKTVLDGLNVVWENEDALSVVLAGDVTSVAEFSAESVDGAEAKFVYAGTEALALEDATSAYAVYPVSAVSQEGGIVKISHTLPEVQTGVVESGMNLSSAALSVEELVAGQATAQFKNALALLQVVVPAGVSEVSLHTATGAALVGDMTFNVVDGVLTVASTGTRRTVTLSTGSELAAGTHNLLVYPGYAPTLTLTMTATDGAVYTSEVSAIRFTASESRTINLTQIFKMGTEETMYVSPAGGEVVVPVVTAADYTYEVAIEGNPEWLTYALPTKAFHGENIVFTATRNETGAERSANVTISWGENQTRTFTIAQKAVYMDFVNDADGNPIQWEETFSIYSTPESAVAGTNAQKTYKNVFTIALSDDYNKGTYKVTNIFKTDNIWLNGPTYPNEGGIYYADYADNKLTIKMEGARKSYFFGSDVVLIYNSTDKTFVLEQPAAFAMNQYSSYNKAGVIGSYTAAVKVEEEPDTPVDDPLVGTYDMTYKKRGVSDYLSDGTDATGTMVIEPGSSTGNYLITKLFDIAVSLTATLDGANFSFKWAGTPITFTYDPATQIFTYSSRYSWLSDYVTGQFNHVTATKHVEANPLAAFLGPWTETYVNKPYSWSSETVYNGEFIVSEKDGKLYFENMFIYKMGSTVYTSNYYGTLSDDGTTITLDDANQNSPHGYFGPLANQSDSPIVLTVEGNTLKVASAYGGNVKNYVATKK